MKIDLAGKRFGKLTVIGFAGVSKQRNREWFCRCDCGGYSRVNTRDLNNGNTTSCGCNRSIAMTKVASKHGLRYSPEYRLWLSIKQRCFHPSQNNYKDYGGRGIMIAEEWKDDPVAFCRYIREVLGPKPTPKHSIDRIDVNGHYEPGNLRWATRSEQQANKRG